MPCTERAPTAAPALRRGLCCPRAVAALAALWPRRPHPSPEAPPVPVPAPSAAPLASRRLASPAWGDRRRSAAAAAVAADSFLSFAARAGCLPLEHRRPLRSSHRLPRRAVAMIARSSARRSVSLTVLLVQAPRGSHRRRNAARLRVWRRVQAAQPSPALPEASSPTRQGARTPQAAAPHLSRLAAPRRAGAPHTTTHTPTSKPLARQLLLQRLVPPLARG